MDKTFLQNVSSSLIIVFARVIHFDTIFEFKLHSCKNKDNIFKTLI